MKQGGAIMGFLFGRNKGKNIPSNAVFRITQEGEEKLQEFNGDPKSQILMALKTRGSSNMVELAQATGLGRGKMEKLLPQLTPVYVQYVNTGAGVEGE